MCDGATEGLADGLDEGLGDGLDDGLEEGVREGLSVGALGDRRFGGLERVQGIQHGWADGLKDGPEVGAELFRLEDDGARLFPPLLPRLVQLERRRQVVHVA